MLSCIPWMLCAPDYACGTHGARCERPHTLDARDHARARSPEGGQGARTNARSTGSKGSGEAASNRRCPKHWPLTFNRPITRAHSQRATYRTSTRALAAPAPRFSVFLYVLLASRERHVQKDMCRKSHRDFRRGFFHGCCWRRS
jgi:hypothetical protein